MISLVILHAINRKRVSRTFYFIHNSPKIYLLCYTKIPNFTFQIQKYKQSGFSDFLCRFGPHPHGQLHVHVCKRVELTEYVNFMLNLLMNILYMRSHTTCNNSQHVVSDKTSSTFIPNRRRKKGVIALPVLIMKSVIDKCFIYYNLSV